MMPLVVTMKSQPFKTRDCRSLEMNLCELGRQSRHVCQKRRHPMQNYLLRTLLIGSLLVTPLASGSSSDDAKIVAALDTEY